MRSAREVFFILRLRRCFSRLGVNDFTLTSDETDEYNCFAWAAGENDRWWEPAFGQGYYWPLGVPFELSRASLVAAFETVGYITCPNGDIEEGFEKLAIYEKGGAPQHAARQRPDGSWTSKCGALADLTHELRGLEGNGPEEYGQVAVFMKRPRV